MRGDAVTLREVVADDLRTFFRHQSDPLSVQMARVPARDEAAYFAHWARLLADDMVGKRTITLGDVVAGQVISFNRDGVRELGYWVGREFWGHGVARAAVQQYLTLEWHRPLYAVVAEHNVASRRILSRSGFGEVSRQGDVIRYQLSAAHVHAPIGGQGGSRGIAATFVGSAPRPRL